MIRNTLLSTVALAALTLPNGAQAADVGDSVYDWSGFYFGGLIGAAGISSENNMNYSSGSGSPAEGWTGGAFHGDVYNSIDSMVVDSNFQLPTNGTMPALRQWPSSRSTEDNMLVGTAFLGYNFQNDNLIFGGELRASFGDFGASNSSSWSDFGTKSGSVGYDIEGTNSFVYEDFGNVLNPPGNILPGFNNFEGVSYTATYHQDDSLKSSAEFNYMISPVARLGFAVDRLQFFVMGGPTYSRVESKTSASIHEYTSDASTTTTPPSTTNPFDADKTYGFSGSNTESKWGYTVGGGTEWAVTDNILLRVEGSYHDFGSTSVTGRSSDTEATYKVKQDLTGYSVSTGVVFKF